MKKDSIEYLVNYGQDKVDDSATISVKLKDVIYVYKTFEELIRFFHNKSHFSTVKDVVDFMGTKNNGMLSVLWKDYYHIVSSMLPDHIHEQFDDGYFSSDGFPYYYNKNKNE